MMEVVADRNEWQLNLERLSPQSSQSWAGPERNRLLIKF